MSNTDIMKMLLESTRKQIREAFINFKNHAFPQSKQDALDHNTVCMIEDEFRNQEDICMKSLESAYRKFIADSEKWQQIMSDSLNRFAKMSTNVMRTAELEMRSHTFTYDIPLHMILPVFKSMENWLAEREKSHISMIKRLEDKKSRVHNAWDTVRSRHMDMSKNPADEFNRSVENMLLSEMATSHKQIKNLIHQNYLQRVGAEHGMN